MKPFLSAEANKMAHRTNERPPTIQPPESGAIANTSHNHCNDWPDNVGQLEYFGSPGFEYDSSIYRTALTPGSVWSISPIKRSGRPTSTVQMAGHQAYPSRELNSRHARLHQTYPSQELNSRYPGQHLSPPNSDSSWSPPPLPPPLPLSNANVLARTAHADEVISMATQSEHSHDFARRNHVKIHIEEMTSMATGFNDLNANSRKLYNDEPAVDANVFAAQLKSERLGVNDYCNGMSAIPSEKKHRASRATKENKHCSSRTTNTKKCSAKTILGILVPNELDVLRGRGGLTNRHEGNKRFRDEARTLRALYRNENTTREEKFQLSQVLVRRVKEYGGRFLEMGGDQLWHEMDELGARKKSSQEDSLSIFKKRSREEEAWDDAFQDKLSKDIPRAVTYPEEDDNDDKFVSSLLGEGDDTVATVNFPHQAKLEVAPWQLPSAKVAFMENDDAYDLAMFRTAHEVPVPEPSAMLLGHSINELDLKMPTAEPQVHKKPPHFSLPTSTAINADIKSMTAPPTMFVERWTCDVCKSCSFETFDEAQAHEIQCQRIHGAQQKSDELLKAQMSEAANALTSLAFYPPLNENKKEDDDSFKIPAKRHPSINLVPQGGESVLSDYNNLLVRHIEFYYPSSDNRVGLRCIHCKDHPQHVTAATFFPSTIGSISSGLGTIGVRHFSWGKCPFVQPEVVQQMIETKKTSNLQTRTNGRVGLDVYCKKLAKHFGITDDINSGICWEVGTEAGSDLVDDDIVQRNPSTSHESIRISFHESNAVDSNCIASVLAKLKDDINIESRPFIPSETEYFWECDGCRSIPFDYRAKGSVVHSVGEPPREKIEWHLKNCTGDKPLAIPRSATIEPYYGEGVPTIKVKWDGKRSSGRSTRALNSVKVGVEDGQLCYQEDQQYTTEYAFFVVSQLKKCYLTKSGGSRGACPVGFAGLACTHCAGCPNERRFFYTSADHLRNSFSHIPSHLGECSACPTDVKVRLEELKVTRNRQKSQLKQGYHKIFIDLVWERIHGCQESDDEEDESYGIDSDPALNAPLQLLVPPHLIQDTEKTSTSDLAYFTLLQVEPHQTFEPSASFDEAGEESSREIGFPGLICRHCMITPVGRKFFTSAAEHLGDLLLTIASHLCSCNECPSTVKTQIASYMLTHEYQIQKLGGEHDMCMNRVWQRMMEASKIPAKKAAPIAAHEIYDPTMSVVTASDARLVTDFTLFTMQQVRPCKLDNSGSGSRGSFEFGFPGLACIWCSGESNSRRFFYRTAEILAGNYAHIPNHLMSCTRVPEEIKRQLNEKREAHQMLKHSLPKGSQKQFFEAVWERLHRNA
ncbi:hypothetical protein ACHAXA_007087 [Cyclostephanos tholiformis]|uniref:DUF6824 domain-containing protein n=1 Tax=Cyclostephanos tholiformis TaxID=382380 RepID=A0ABD3RZ68_9STRA